MSPTRIGSRKANARRLGWVFCLRGIVLYSLAWEVTDIRPDRLITRFQDLRGIANDLIHPDLFTTDPVTGAISPSENFGDIFGRVVDVPAPDWLVKLGLCQRGAEEFRSSRRVRSSRRLRSDCSPRSFPPCSRYRSVSWRRTISWRAFPAARSSTISSAHS